MGAKTDASTTKYEIKAHFEVDGIVERPDIIGALYGQTDGLLSEELDIRELQKSGKIGRINVELRSSRGKTSGTILIPTSLARTETAILAATIETVDRVGPCTCQIHLREITDVRVDKRKSIVNRASEIIRNWDQNVSPFVSSITSEVEKSAKAPSSVIKLGKEKITAGRGFETSSKVILVEGRADIINLLKVGIDNTIAVDGTSVPRSLKSMLKDKTVTAFLDGDRGGDLILKELLQVANIDKVARAPEGKEVEDLKSDEIKKALDHATTVKNAIFLTGSHEGMTVEDFIKKTKAKNTFVIEEEKPTKIERKPEVQKREPKKDVKQEARKTTSHVTKHRHPPKSQKSSKYSKSGQRPRSSKYQSKRYKDRSARYQERKVHLPDHLDAALKEIKQKLEAVVIDENQNQILKTEAKNIYKELLSIEKANTLLLDGIATQRVLEVAYNKGISMIICARLGDLTKKPSALKIVEYKNL